MKKILLIMTVCLAINCQANADETYVSNSYDGIIGGHEYVDLGLPSGTLWATYNVGASTPYEKGLYFAWGEVEPRENFTWESYKFFNGIETDPNNGQWAILENIGDDISGSEYDAARHQWGYGWRLPNEQERYELRMICWNNGITKENGFRGVRIHGPNGHSIFLPTCGFGLWYGEEDPFSNDAAYWTGVEEKSYGYNGKPIEPSNRAISFAVDHGGFNKASSVKAYGLNIRAVVNPKEAGIEDVISNVSNVTLAYRNGCIHIFGNTSDGMVSVYDLSGRLMYSNSAVDGVCQLPILSDGVFIVTFAENGNRMKTQKIAVY